MVPLMGAERSVARAQTWERGLSLTWVKILLLFWLKPFYWVHNKLETDSWQECKKSKIPKHLWKALKYVKFPNHFIWFELSYSSLPKSVTLNVTVLPFLVLYWIILLLLYWRDCYQICYCCIHEVSRMYKLWLW
jgi:hypothetical protein